MLPPIAEVGPLRIDIWLILSIIIRVLHIGSAAIIIGGLAYRRLVLAGNPLDQSYDESMRKPWAMWVGIASGVLLLTGIYNTVLYMASGYYEKLHFTYHAAWGLKILLALALMWWAALLAGRSDRAKGVQQSEIKWLNTALVTAALLLAVAGFMHSFPKLPATPGVEIVAP